MVQICRIIDNIERRNKGANKKCKFGKRVEEDKISVEISTEIGEEIVNIVI